MIHKPGSYANIVKSNQSSTCSEYIKVARYSEYIKVARQRRLSYPYPALFGTEHT